MGFGNILIVCFLIYYTFYFAMLFSSSKRQTVKNKNTQLDKLRDIPVKTLEQQKAFLSLKYPKKEKYVFKWKDVVIVLLYVLVAFSLYRFFNIVLNTFKVDIPLYASIIIVIVLPILINYVLKKFNLQRDDLLVLIRGRVR